MWLYLDLVSIGGMRLICRQRLFEAQRQETQSANESLVSGRFLEALGELIEAEVPNTLLSSLAEQEFTSKLLDLQSAVRTFPGTTG